MIRSSGMLVGVVLVEESTLSDSDEKEAKDAIPDRPLLEALLAIDWVNTRDGINANILI